MPSPVGEGGPLAVDEVFFFFSIKCALLIRHSHCSCHLLPQEKAFFIAPDIAI